MVSYQYRNGRVPGTARDADPRAGGSGGCGLPAAGHWGWRACRRRTRYSECSVLPACGSSAYGGGGSSRCGSSCATSAASRLGSGSETRAANSARSRRPISNSHTIRSLSTMNRSTPERPPAVARSAPAAASGSLWTAVEGLRRPHCALPPWAGLNPFFRGPTSQRNRKAQRSGPAP
jgi:hypothetical protein